MYLSAHAHAVDAALEMAPRAPEAATLLEHWLRAQGLHAVDVPASPTTTSPMAAGMVDGMPRLVLRSVLAMLILQDKLVRAVWMEHISTQTPCCHLCTFN